MLFKSYMDLTCYNGFTYKQMHLNSNHMYKKLQLYIQHKYDTNILQVSRLLFKYLHLT